MRFPCDYIIHCEPNEKEKEVTWSDFEELIRCKDCKHYDGYFCHHDGYGDGYANYTPPIKSEDGFCDWAGRREE